MPKLEVQQNTSNGFGKYRGGGLIGGVGLVACYFNGFVDGLGGEAGSEMGEMRIGWTPIGVWR